MVVAGPFPDLAESALAAKAVPPVLERAGQGHARPLTGESLLPHALERMLKRRLPAAGLPEILSSHSFRVLVVTDPHRFNGSTRMAVHVCLVRRSYRQKQSIGFSGDRVSLWIFSTWPLRGTRKTAIRK